MASVKVSATEEILLPPEAREALHAHPGEELIVTVCGETVILTRKQMTFSEALFGIAKGVYPPDYLKSERESWE